MYVCILVCIYCVVFKYLQYIFYVFTLYFHRCTPSDHGGVLDPGVQHEAQEGVFSQEESRGVCHILTSSIPPPPPLLYLLQAVFIDTYYKQDDQKEKAAFDKNTMELFHFANTRCQQLRIYFPCTLGFVFTNISCSAPFACKDIKIALTEIMELNNDLEEANRKTRWECGTLHI